MQRIFVCTNLREATGQPSCAARGSRELIKYLEQGIADRQMSWEVKESVCFGHCDKGPNVKPMGEPFRHGLGLEDVDDFLDELARV